MTERARIVEVKKNQEYEIKIESFGNSGEGISHIDGYTLFVSGALPGEKVKVVVTKAKKNYGYARLLSVIEPSPDRVEPVCPVAKRCGGCDLQHMNYEAGLAFKVKHVRDCIERIGGVEIPLLEAIGCEKNDGEYNPWHYRNKAQFPVGLDRSGKPVAGFYASRSHEIIPCENCALQDEQINRAVSVVMDTVRDAVKKNNDIKLIYDEISHTGWLRHIYVRRAVKTGKLFICLVVNDKNIDKLSKEKQDILNTIINRADELGDEVSVCINQNTEKTNVVLGRDYKAIKNNTYIEDRIDDLTFCIAPESFYQVNSFMTEKLYDKALEYAALSGDEVVWDLYCGIGTISLFLSKKARKVVGVEIVEQAIKNAKENARINGIDNASFYCGAAEDIISEVMKDQDKKSAAGSDLDVVDMPDVVVVDPPRKGCDEKLIAAIGEASPSSIVYVSCDPATLARDIARLREYGYTLKKACVVDQFWQTRHVESIALLQRMSNTRSKEITLDVDMEDYYRIKGDRTND